MIFYSIEPMTFRPVGTARLRPAMFRYATALAASAVSTHAWDSPTLLTSDALLGATHCNGIYIVEAVTEVLISCWELRMKTICGGPVSSSYVQEKGMSRE